MLLMLREKPYMFLRFYLTIFIFLFFFSCKKKENVEPKITITSPLSGTVYVPGDTIQVEADISDDNELGSVTLKLLSASYTPVDHQESFAVNAKTYHLSYDYVINNAYLETGNYFLTL